MVESKPVAVSAVPGVLTLVWVEAAPPVGPPRASHRGEPCGAVERRADLIEPVEAAVPIADQEALTELGALTGSYRPSYHRSYHE
jgi:hypothetical protein